MTVALTVSFKLISFEHLQQYIPQYMVYIEHCASMAYSARTGEHKRLLQNGEA